MSGALRAIEDAFGIVRHGGNVVLFGIPVAAGRDRHRRVAHLQEPHRARAVNGRKIWETWYTTRWLLEHGVVDLRPLITAELPLERFEEAFALLEAGEACKIVLRPNGADAMTSVDARDRAARAPELDALREAGTYKRFLTLESAAGPGRPRWQGAAR